MKQTLLKISFFILFIVIGSFSTSTIYANKLTSSPILITGGNQVNIKNNTGWNIGLVTLYFTNGTNTTIIIDSTLNHNIIIPAPIGAMKIGSTTVISPNAGHVLIPLGHYIKVNWDFYLFDPDED